MRVQLLPFGVLKDSLTASAVELPAGATVADLLAVVGERLGAETASAQLLARVAVSVNAEYAVRGQVLCESDVVGLLPPVSGGRGPDAIHTGLTRNAIESDRLIADAKQGSDGAVVIFDGIVRNNTRGRRTLYLDYEAYEEMAERQMASLAVQAVERFGVRGVTLMHRLGRVAIGETSVLIVVSSAHRAAAYEASRWLIDTLKTTVPIWKKEMFADGAVWANGEAFPEALLAGPEGVAL